MKSELLAFKYKSLKLKSQFTDKGIVRVGWQCRKYVKWTDVHVGDDRDLLKAFSDFAVDDKKIDFDKLPRINEILLNVQRWRLDKEEWSVEPEHEKSWDHARELILASAGEPRILVSYLTEYFESIDLIPDDLLAKSFLKLLVFELVLSGMRIKDSKVTVHDVLGATSGFFSALEEGKCLIPELTILSACEDIDEAIELLDLPKLSEPKDIGQYRNTSTAFSGWVTVLDANLPESKLFKIEEIKGVQTIYLNTNNKFIIQMNQDDVLRDFFTKFLLAYVKTISDSPTISKHLEDFNSYLALNLNREFS